MSATGCSEVRRDPTIVVEENGRKFIINNHARETVTKIRVDGCLITGAVERCDFLFEIGASCHCAVFVELKGCDVRKAYKQLSSTLTLLRGQYGCARRVCYIVASRVPKMLPGVQQMVVQMARQHRALLRVGTRQVGADVQADLHP